MHVCAVQERPAKDSKLRDRLRLYVQDTRQPYSCFWLHCPPTVPRFLDALAPAGIRCLRAVDSRSRIDVRIVCAQLAKRADRPKMAPSQVPSNTFNRCCSHLGSSAARRDTRRRTQADVSRLGIGTGPRCLCAVDPLFSFFLWLCFRVPVLQYFCFSWREDVTNRMLFVVSGTV